MIPIKRFNSIVISLTTICVFIIWYYVSIFLKSPPCWLKDFPTTQKAIVIFVLTGLLSHSIYKIVFVLFAYVIKQTKWIKKLIFSSSYLEGTWIGFYLGYLGKVRYVIETFEQDLDGLVIRGKAFDENLIFHSTWIANTVNIDPKKGQLSYHYKVESPIEVSDQNGIAFFNFERDNTNKPPESLIGFSADLHLGTKCKATEIKKSNKTIYDISIALNEAKEFFEKNKLHFQKKQ